MTSDLDNIVSEFSRFFSEYKVLPPGSGNFVACLAKNPDRYLRFCHGLAKQNPRAMRVLINSECGESVSVCDDGKQCGEEFEKDYL